MVKTSQILVRAIALAASAAALASLAACGQRGPLYLPTEPAARDRATLPQTLKPGSAPTQAPTSTEPDTE
jgi:predicted small lipoprotein YifL